MRKNKERSIETAIRLDAIVKNLGIGKHWDDRDSEEKVVEACLHKVDTLINNEIENGENLALQIANHFKVKFEEVRNNADIDSLENTYLKQKKEMGFALLRDELTSPNVDALLIQRRNATQEDLDQWVAVLNLLFTDTRAYWNRFHELSHRLAEPPQKVLPFRRQITTDIDEVERLMDKIAGEIAFYKKLFIPYFSQQSKEHLTFGMIESTKNRYSPSSSLLAITNAMVQRWDRPAIAFTASFRTKRNGKKETLALRIQLQAGNTFAQDVNLTLFNNMRVPPESCVYLSFTSKLSITEEESTSLWKTSTGNQVPEHRVVVSTMCLGDFLYGVMTL